CGLTRQPQVITGAGIKSKRNFAAVIKAILMDFYLAHCGFSLFEPIDLYRIIDPFALPSFGIEVVMGRRMRREHCSDVGPPPAGKRRDYQFRTRGSNNLETVGGIRNFHPRQATGLKAWPSCALPTVDYSGELAPDRDEFLNSKSFGVMALSCIGRLKPNHF